MLKRFILASALLLIGCSKPEAPVPGVVQAVAAWEKRSAELSAAIKPGMTEDEVTKVAGNASRTKTLMTGGDALVMWEYDLGENNRFKVRFDKNGRVASARLESGMVN
ncbi:MAG: hypothetical protein WCS70_13155 [Verrucomicrobiota bacterium]